MVFVGVASFGRTLVGVCLTIACVAPPNRAHAQDPVPPRTELREWVQDTEQLGSLDERIGVMAAEPRSRIQEGYIYLWLSPSVQGSVCVYLTGHDGYYRAEGEFNLPSARTSSRIRLELRSRRLSMLQQRYTTDGLAILVVLEPDCTSGRRPYVLASWSRGANPREGVALLSARAIRTTVAAASVPGPETVCRKVENLSTMKYDVRCTFPLSPQGTMQEFEIRRLDENGDRPADIPLPVLSP